MHTPPGLQRPSVAVHRTKPLPSMQDSQTVPQTKLRTQLIETVHDSDSNRCAVALHTPPAQVPAPQIR